MSNFGEGKNAQDVELMKTDDFDSEEADIFERVKKFKELQKRFDKHRQEMRHLRGNDLRYNVYLKKMNKLTRMDLGLDVEAYKDYVNNLKIFAKFNSDYEILAQDTSISQNNGLLSEEQIEKARVVAAEQKKLSQMKNTISKLYRDYHNPLTQHDKDIIEEFARKPNLFLDYDLGLALDIKRLYDKRKAELDKRLKMGVVYIQTVSEATLLENDISKREYEMIKKLMAMDERIFAASHNPNSFAVDLSKYSGKIP